VTDSKTLESLALRALIVDLDGTLVDTLGDFEVALNRMLADLDLPPIDRLAIEARVGKGSEHLIRTVLSLVQVQAPEAWGGRHLDDLCVQAWPRYQHHYLAINGAHSQVYPGAASALAGFRALGYRMACLTNKPTAFARPLLEAKGLLDYFELVFGGDAFARKKPDPLPLLETCAALGVAPSQALMIGDSSNDAQAAQAAGCPVVLVSYGYNHGLPVRTIPADAWVDSMLDIRLRSCEPIQVL